MPTPQLHRRFPELRETLPHLRLGLSPTPVWEIRALSTGKAPVWVKDDSVFGSGGWGGNKVRKLEWLLPELLRRGRTRLVTVGGLGTNWGLVAALYGKAQGMDVTLVLVDQPEDDHVRAQLARLGESGATLRFAHGRGRATAWVVATLAARPGSTAYLPVGGSSALGVLGYVETGLELGAQVAAGLLPEPTHVVVPVGSGGTTAGLALGLRLAGLRTRVVGVLVNDRTKVDPVALAQGAAAELTRRGARLDIGEFYPALDIVRDWIGAGYGHPLPAGEAATGIAARAGLVLEPVYTAKAVAGLLEMNAEGRFGGGPVVYLHTHGPRSA